MKSSKVATRYAQALLELAIEKNSLDTVSADMAYLVTVSAENRDFELMLNSPIVKTDKKVAILNAVFENFTEVSRSFMELIARNGRESFLPAIAEAYGDLLKEFKGIHPVTIISATPLEASVKKSILSKIETKMTGTLEVTEKVDPALVGGFIVKMGDYQIDASIASQLGQLKQRLTK